MARKYITHEEVKSAFSEVYNKFYLVYRKKEDTPRSDADWEQLLNAARTIRRKYDSEFVNIMITALIEQFEAEEREQK